MKIVETFATPQPKEMAGRLQGLQAAMQRENLDTYVCFASANILWLTNFANFIHERPFILVIPQQGKPSFVVPQLELDHVNHRVIGDVEFASYSEFPAPNGSRWQDRLKGVVPDGARIGIEGMLPAAILSVLGSDARLINLVDQLREIKSDYELGRIAYGCRLKTEAHAELLAMARPGLSQAEINGTIGKTVYAKMIADNPQTNPFATSIMTLIQNASACHDPHNFTNLDMQLQAGGPHISIFNSVLNGYGAEIERTFFLGSIPEAAKAPYEIMMQARRIAFEMTRPGEVMGDIDRCINRLFEQQGYGDARRHRAGHGMGVTAHEGPFLADGDEGEIKPGMVFTIEPGIYFPGLGGFRHSDTVVVTQTGSISLTHGPDSLEDLTL